MRVRARVARERDPHQASLIAHITPPVALAMEGACRSASQSECAVNEACMYAWLYVVGMGVLIWRVHVTPCLLKTQFYLFK
jgi:hypothetical protein